MDWARVGKQDRRDLLLILREFPGVPRAPPDRRTRAGALVAMLVTAVSVGFDLMAPPDRRTRDRLTRSCSSVLGKRSR